MKAQTRAIQFQFNLPLMWLWLLLIFMLLISPRATAFPDVNVGAVMQGPIINADQRAQQMQFEQQRMSQERVDQNMRAIEYYSNTKPCYGTKCAAKKAVTKSHR